MSDIPEHLGKYEILGEVGRGGFATVYEAQDGRLNRRVALKVMLKLDPGGALLKLAKN